MRNYCMKKKLIKCELCGRKFENFARMNGRKKRFCEECIKRRNNEYNRKYNQRRNLSAK